MKIKIAFYDTHSYDRESFTQMNKNFLFNIDFFDFKLTEQTALTSQGYNAVCVFVNDKLDDTVIKILKENGVQLIILRCAGFNNVDIRAAKENDITVVRVPAYSPYAVAEHAMAMVLSLTRKIPQAFMRTRNGNFTIDGLTGRNLFGLTCGIIGTGKIGKIMANIAKGFGMNVVLYDIYPDKDWALNNGFTYTTLPDFFMKSDIISLHCPLTEETKHIINEESLKLMKKDALIVNTGRGALIDTQALVNALKRKAIGGAALDVYEEESNYFFADWSVDVIKDDILARLMTFPNVLITSHQAFLTKEALENIAEVSMQNAKDFFEGKELLNQVK